MVFFHTLLPLWHILWLLLQTQDSCCSKFSISLLSQRFTVPWASMIHLMEVLEVTPSHLFHQRWKLADIEETGEKCHSKRNTASVWLFGLFNWHCATLRASTNFSFIFSCLSKVSVGNRGGEAVIQQIFLWGQHWVTSRNTWAVARKVAGREVKKYSAVYSQVPYLDMSKVSCKHASIIPPMFLFKWKLNSRVWKLLVSWVSAGKAQRIHFPGDHANGGVFFFLIFVLLCLSLQLLDSALSLKFKRTQTLLVKYQRNHWISPAFARKSCETTSFPHCQCETLC